MRPSHITNNVIFWRDFDRNTWLTWYTKISKLLKLLEFYFLFRLNLIFSGDQMNLKLLKYRDLNNFIAGEKDCHLFSVENICFVILPHVIVQMYLEIMS